MKKGCNEERKRGREEERKRGREEERKRGREEGERELLWRLTTESNHWIF